MNTTVRMKASQITKDWHVIDAAGRPLGRVATEAATLLKGKHKPTYEPHLDDGDFVIILNASKIRMTGHKSAQMKYYTHSGYPGGLKTRTFEEMITRYPERVIEQAVWGMLPKGPLGKQMYKHLKVYRGPNHPHQSQITGSERARAAREAAAEAAGPLPYKPVRLRPLGITQEEREAAEAQEMSRLEALRANTRDSTVKSQMAAQEETTLSSETPPPAASVTVEGETTVDYGTPTPAEAAIEAEQPEASAAPEAPAEEKKPRRRRAAKATEDTETSESEE